MRRKGLFFRPVLEVFVFVIFILLIILLFQFRPGGRALFSQEATSVQTAYPIQEEATPPTPDALEGSQPYPPPTITAAPPPLPARIQALNEKRAALGDVPAAVLDRGNVWLILPGKAASMLQGIEGVAALFGWNYDGTKLLFGKGSYKSRGEMENTTELWIYDLSAGKEYRLSDNTRVWSAAWSPVDDRVGVCEYNAEEDLFTLFIVALDGKVLQSQKYVHGEFTWSADGDFIAVRYGGPEFLDFDTYYPVLGIWSLKEDELRLISEAKRESHSNFVWTLDAQFIIFNRLTDGGDSGLHIVNVWTSQMERVQNQPKLMTSDLSRSPRSNALVFSLGPELFTMDEGQEPIFIGRGSRPIWHPDGRTVFYIDESGIVQIVDTGFKVLDYAVKGNISSHPVRFQPSISFPQDNNQ